MDKKDEKSINKPKNKRLLVLLIPAPFVAYGQLLRGKICSTPHNLLLYGLIISFLICGVIGVVIISKKLKNRNTNNPPASVFVLKGLIMVIMASGYLAIILIDGVFNIAVYFNSRNSPIETYTCRVVDFNKSVGTRNSIPVVYVNFEGRVVGFQVTKANADELKDAMPLKNYDATISIKRSLLNTFVVDSYTLRKRTDSL